jgi:AAA15 family ATPase/GTPase
MLISFRFSNYKSYKDETIFTTVCGDLKDLEENFSQIQNYKLLKSSIFIGANGSGKSNLIQAVQKFQAILQNSINIEKQKSYPHEPFFLDEKTKEKATFFEIEFFLDEIYYRYNFKIEKDATISEEYLEEKEPNKNRRYLFKRENENFKINSRSFKEAKGLKEKTSPKSLFLSVVAQFNGEKSKNIYDFLTDKIIVLHDLDCDKNRFFEISKTLLKDEFIKEKSVEFLKNLDLSLEDIEVKKEFLPKSLIEKIKDDIKLTDNEIKELEENGIENIYIYHFTFDNGDVKKIENFPIAFESEGTKKLILLVPFLINALKKNQIIFIDEIDNSIHTLLIKKILKEFQKYSDQAQLFFTTHDLCLLNKPLVLRRDQIWLVEKDRRYLTSKLYSLYDYNIRNDKNILKGYFEREFGAIPYLD